MRQKKSMSVQANENIWVQIWLSPHAENVNIFSADYEANQPNHTQMLSKN